MYMCEESWLKRDAYNYRPRPSQKEIILLVVGSPLMCFPVYNFKKQLHGAVALIWYRAMAGQVTC